MNQPNILMVEAVALFFCLLVLAPKAQAQPETADPVKKEAAPSSTNPPSSQVTAPADPPAKLGSSIKPVGRDTWEISVDDICQLVASMPFVMTQLWVREVMKGGKLVGYKVKHIADGSLPYRAGFRNDDVVMRINNQSLDEPMKLLWSLLDTTQKQIIVELDRGGKTTKHTFKIIGASGQSQKNALPMDSP